MRSTACVLGLIAIGQLSRLSRARQELLPAEAGTTSPLSPVASALRRKNFQFTNRMLTGDGTLVNSPAGVSAPVF